MNIHSSTFFVFVLELDAGVQALETHVCVHLNECPHRSHTSCYRLLNELATASEKVCGREAGFGTTCQLHGLVEIARHDLEVAETRVLQEEALVEMDMSMAQRRCDQTSFSFHYSWDMGLVGAVKVVRLNPVNVSRSEVNVPEQRFSRKACTTDASHTSGIGEGSRGVGRWTFRIAQVQRRGTVDGNVAIGWHACRIVIVKMDGRIVL